MMDAIAEAKLKSMVLTMREDIRQLNRRVYILELAVKVSESLRQIGLE